MLKLYYKFNFATEPDKTTDEEEKAHSITAIWNFEKQNYYLKDLKR
ncbi:MULTISPECIES: hypothetical protein [Staphylococcus]|nr:MULTISPECIES: hypothetical protein [Staphylococcus]MBL0377805.1 hypothetical protein [Staphylococcus sp. S75]MBL0382614.1 hypothetical protein [Staphylococcus sp. S59]MBL0401284.1 hypothetical protein [Staphylococcus sp. S36]